MHRLCLDTKVSAGGITVSDRRQLHYLKDVLRLGAGDEVIVFDRVGHEYLCAIREVSHLRARLEVTAQLPGRFASTGITVACALPKQGFDELIDSLTQLGADAIIPVQSERVVVRPDTPRQAARLERWTRIARSAARQSCRNTVPAIEPLTGFADVIARAKDFDLKLIPTLAGERRELPEVLAGTRPANILVLIGPEGDFTPGEIAQALAAGFTAVSLGDLVLRVGTAAIGVVSYLRFALAGCWKS